MSCTKFLYKMSKKLKIALTLLTGLILSVSIPLPANGSSLRYDITKYGAKGDGKTLNTIYIQKTIDECSKSGGGVVVVPEGKFITGAIYLKQGVDLTVEKGGLLKGSFNHSDYQHINTRLVGILRIWT